MPARLRVLLVRHLSKVVLLGLTASCTAEPAPLDDRPSRSSPRGEASSRPSGDDDAEPTETEKAPPGAPPSASTGCGSASVAPGDHDWTISSGGRERVARVHVPPGYDASRPTPVLLNFHGRLSSASQQELLSQTTPKADAAGFVVVYPSGVGQTWNGGFCCGTAQSENVDDVGFTRALVDELERRLCVDKKRVFATGLSNGGFMSHRLACELSDRIAAIGPVAGHLLMPSCAPSRPVPVIHFHGTSDNIVPYGGGLGMLSVESSIADWAKRNGCSGTPKQTFAKGDATCRAYEGCSAGAAVTLCTVQGGGHTWPGGTPVPLLGKTSTDISATNVMWSFFEQHPMP